MKNAVLISLLVIAALACFTMASAKSVRHPLASRNCTSNSKCNKTSYLPVFRHHNRTHHNRTHFNVARFNKTRRVSSIRSRIMGRLMAYSFPIYRQYDSRWGSQIVGSGDKTIKQIGCLMTSVTMILAGIGARVNGQFPDPGNVNSWLKSHGGYQGNLFIWTAVQGFGLGYEGQTSASSAKAALAAGKFVVLNVKNGGHWVLATSLSGTTFEVNDPGSTRTQYPIGEVVRIGIYNRRRLETPAPLQASCGSCKAIYDMVAENEGKRSCVYKDTMGHPTIGIGMNLDRGDAKAILTRMGLNYNDVRSGKKCLSESQIKSIFEGDLKWAREGAAASVPNFSRLPNCVQNVAIDMTFNMGKYSLKGWGNFVTQLSHEDFQGAANNLQGSLLCKQVGSRCTRNVAILRGCRK